MIKLVELLGGLFKTKTPIKAKKIGDDSTTTVYEVDMEEIGLHLGNQKNFGEIFKKKPNLFNIYIKNQDRRGKKFFEAKPLAEKIKTFLEDKEIPYNLDDTHDSWVFSVDKKHINISE